MANGITRIRLFFDIVDGNLKSGLNSVTNRVEKATGHMQSRMNSLKRSNIEAFRAIKDEIPGASRAIELMANPIMAVTAGVAALGYGLFKATEEATKFSGGFRQLQMLNLDKSVKDMGKLKEMIRSTSYEKGFDPTETIKAFFDVQSVTGKYGSEVDNIVAKQGEFARLMQADFKQWIAGSAKAMANYGFGFDKLDEFNKAAFATVQTGVTTFDELAQVQSVFAGAAAASKQSFASADKIFSIFTVKVKDVNEAATLTKSLFNDLSKATTIDSFKKLGINVFDANKHFKQADTLLIELQDKFRKLGTNDSKLIELKNMFQGSEGLIAFVQAATDKTNTLQQTINTFDATQFALPKALEIAKNDINYINEQLENKTKVLMGDIGENFIPIKKFFAEVMIGGIEGVKRLWADSATMAEQYKNEASKNVLKDFPGFQNPTKLTEKAFEEMMGSVNRDLKVYQDIAQKNIGFKNTGDLANHFNPQKAQGFYNYTYGGAASEALMTLTKQAREARSGMPSNDFAGVKNGSSTKTDSLLNPIVANDAKSIGTGSQSKNVTINIESFVKGGLNTTASSINGMNKDELERWMTEMFMRVVRSAETAM
jgi:TP901 family phage tail tape measure protein